VSADALRSDRALTHGGRDDSTTRESRGAAGVAFTIGA